MILRAPRYGQVARCINLKRFAENPVRPIRLELEQVLSADDGQDEDVDVEELLNDPKRLAATLAERSRLYNWLLEQGRVEAVCPQCGSPTELDLLFYTITIGLPPWRALDGNAIATPALADPEPPSPSPLQPYDEPPVALRGVAPRPPQIKRAARIDFALPSARARLAAPDDAVRGTLGDVDAQREGAAWRTWAPAGRVQPIERLYWDRHQPGFTAALRLAVAISLTSASGASIEPTPESIERLFLCDVQFLDVLYTATHSLPVSMPGDGSRPQAMVTCQCGERFLPVR